EVLRLAGGLVSRDWLEAKARHVVARALGEEPEIDPARRPLTVGEYLEERGITGPALRSLSGPFGKVVKRLYRDRYDREPPQTDRFVDRKSTRLNSSHVKSSYAVFCLKTTT